jgi:cytochrome bd-type quinol oxidase subunit 1
MAHILRNVDEQAHFRFLKLLDPSKKNPCASCSNWAVFATNLPLVVWSFRVMVGFGLLMIALGLVSAWVRWKGRLYRARWRTALK